MKEVLAEVLANAMEGKTAICEEHNGMVDAPPTILGCLPDGDTFAMPDLNDGHPTDNLPLMLEALAMALLENGKPVRWEWLAYIVEGFAKPAGEVNADDHKRGDLEQEFRENPASSVREGIIVTVHGWKEGESLAGTAFYRYNDRGLPEFDEPEFSELPSGNIADIFSAFRKACHIWESRQNN